MGKYPMHVWRRHVITYDSVPTKHVEQIQGVPQKEKKLTPAIHLRWSCQVLLGQPIYTCMFWFSETLSSMITHYNPTLWKSMVLWQFIYSGLRYFDMNLTSYHIIYYKTSLVLSTIPMTFISLQHSLDGTRRRWGDQGRGPPRGGPSPRTSKETPEHNLPELHRGNVVDWWRP